MDIRLRQLLVGWGSRHEGFRDLVAAADAAIADLEPTARAVADWRRLGLAYCGQILVLQQSATVPADDLGMQKRYHLLPHRNHSRSVAARSWGHETEVVQPAASSPDQRRKSRHSTAGSCYYVGRR